MEYLKYDVNKEIVLYLESIKFFYRVMNYKGVWLSYLWCIE